MNPQDQQKWQDELLDEVLIAMARDGELARSLVFKGARILARLLPDAKRQSLDIDANMREEFHREFPDRIAQAARIQVLIVRAVRAHFEAQDPVRYELLDVQVSPKPKNDHPRGWNALEAKLNVQDLKRSSTRGIPGLSLDIAAPERLGTHSTRTLVVGGAEIQVYSLERIVGEKLRAFLSTCPEHRRKTSGTPREAIRVKDLVDIVQVVKHAPLSDGQFWRSAGTEFLSACESRGVDCDGWATFERAMVHAKNAFVSDATVAHSIPFEEAWSVLHDVIELFESHGIFPFSFTLPPLVHAD